MKLKNIFKNKKLLKLKEEIKDNSNDVKIQEDKKETNKETSSN